MNGKRAGLSSLARRATTEEQHRQRLPGSNAAELVTTTSAGRRRTKCCAPGAAADMARAHASEQGQAGCSHENIADDGRHASSACRAPATSRATTQESAGAMNRMMPKRHGDLRVAAVYHEVLASDGSEAVVAATAMRAPASRRPHVPRRLPPAPAADIVAVRSSATRPHRFECVLPTATRCSLCRPPGAADHKQRDNLAQAEPATRWPHELGAPCRHLGADRGGHHGCASRGQGYHSRRRAEREVCRHSSTWRRGAMPRCAKAH